MGVEPFLVRSSLIAILAQRLVRLLCPACKVPYEPSAYELEQLGLDARRQTWRDNRVMSSRYQPHGTIYEPPGAKLTQDPVFYRAKGCNECMDKGYIGRKGIYELLVVDDAVGSHILQNADAQTIKRAALHEGMDSLRDDGARKVIAGLTTVEEVLAATQQDYVGEG
jgi:general secretion pathway protein E